MVYVDSITGFVYHGESFIGHLNQSELAIVKCLIAQQGEVVSRDDLLLAGWPGRIVVSNSVNMAIKNIRLILSKASNEAVIVTLPREGYRLIPNYIELSYNTVSSSQSEGGASEASGALSRSLNVHFFRWFNYLHSKILSWRFLFFIFILFALWLTMVQFFIARDPLHCVDHKAVKICTVESKGLTQYVLDNAPSEPGTYIYGLDPVTGKGVYEKKN